MMMSHCSDFHVDKDWTFRTTLFKDNHGSKKQHALAQVVAKLNKQCYCPGKTYIFIAIVTFDAFSFR